MPTAPSARRYWLLFLLLVWPTSGFAQSGSLRLVAVHAPTPTQVELLVELPEGVLPVEARDFQLLEDTRATVYGQASKPFRTAGWTFSVVLALDTSGSVKQKLAPMNAALPQFVDRLPADDALAVVTFDDMVDDTMGFGTPRDQVRARVSQLQARGKRTLLYQGLNSALDVLKLESGKRNTRRIVVVSDGADESTDEPNATDGVIKRAVDERVAIDTVWTGRPMVSTRNTLVRLSERTGGTHTDATDSQNLAAELQAALEKVTARVEAAVVVSFDREVAGSATTSRVGVNLSRPGVAPAFVEAQIPQSRVVPPQRQWPWWGLLLLALLAAYLLYAALYALVRIFHPAWIEYFPFVPWPPFGRPFVHEPLVEDEATDYEEPVSVAHRKHTQVSRDNRGAGSSPTSGHALSLEAIEGPLKGQKISINRSHFQVGAGTANDLRISSDKYLSGVHAIFQSSSSQWLVLDQDSNNGTFVDGRKIVGRQGQPLRNGQVIRMGASEFRVVLGSTSKPAVSDERSELPL